MSSTGRHQPDKEVRRVVAAASGHVMTYRAEDLLERFGYNELDNGAVEDVSKRLLALGLTIAPPLADAKASDEVSVSIAEESTPNANVKKRSSPRSSVEHSLSEPSTRAEQVGAQLDAAGSEISASTRRVDELEVRVAELEKLLSRAQEELEQEREQAAARSKRKAAQAKARAEPAARSADGRAREQPPRSPAAVREPSISPQRRRLWQRRRRPFIDRPGECSVCVRELKVATEGDLATSGWIINDEAGLCPDCQRLGWTLPARASLPSRLPSRAS